MMSQYELEQELASREFYELMQTYRHCPLTDFKGTVDAFEAVKDWVRGLVSRAAQPDRGVK